MCKLPKDLHKVNRKEAKHSVGGMMKITVTNAKKFAMIAALASTFILFERLAPGIALLAVAYMIWKQKGIQTAQLASAEIAAPPVKPVRGEVIPLNNSYAPAWKDVDDFLQSTLDVIKGRFQFQTANIFLRGEDKTTLVQRAFISSTNSVARLAVIKVGHGLVGWVAANKRPLSVGNLKHEGRSMGYYRGRGENVSSFVAVPIMAGNDVIGVLSIDNEKPDAFKSPETEESLAAIAGLLARVLGSEVQAETKSREADRIRETRKILRASYGAEDLDAAAQSALRELVTMADFQSVSVYLLDENNKPSRRASIGFNGIRGNEVKDPIVQRAVTQALSQSTPYRIEGVALAAQYRSGGKTSVALPELLVAFPIFNRGDALGALVVELNEKKAFDQRLEGILTDVVSEFGSALMRVYRASTAEGTAKMEAELIRFSSNLLSAENVEEVWGRLFSYLMLQTGATAALAYKKEESGFSIESVAGCSPTEDFVASDAGLVGWTSLAGRAVIASRSDLKRLPLETGESFLILPIGGHASVARAIVILSSDEKGAFTEDHVEKMKEIAETVQPILATIDKLEEARHQLDLDAATGILNESGWQKRANVMALSSPVSVIRICVENWDAIVKEYGRKEARIYLRKVAALLESAGTVARIDDATFAILIKGVAEDGILDLLNASSLSHIHDTQAIFGSTSASTVEGIRTEELIAAADSRARETHKALIEHVA